MAHPVNLLMMAPGGYTFRDFFRIGWRFSPLSFVMPLVGIVIFRGLPAY